MKRHHLSFAVAVLTCLVAVSSPAHAQAQRQHYQQGTGTAPVTLHVPVQLQAMDPAVTGAIVYCRATFHGDVARVQAWAQDTLPLVNGAYNATVDMQLTLSVNAPGEVWDYDCTLSLYDAATKQMYFANYPGGPQWTQAKPGTTPSRQVTGNLTTQ